MTWETVVAICLGLCHYGYAFGVSVATDETADLETCPPKNSIYPILFPHPVDCRKFYICDNGNAHLQTCQPGLHFNRKAKSCDFPDRAGCETGENVSEKPRGKISDDEDLDVCPNKNSKYPELIPHPSECIKFFICDNGKPHLQTCQLGLHFNPKVKACDFPDRAGCSSYIEDPDKQTDDDSDGCPSKNSDHPVYIPHPTDCSKFYICDSGKPHLQVCQAGLHFNRKDKACDFPDRAGCEKGLLRTMAGTGFLSPYCPSVPQSEGPKFFPHSSNCSVYYMCSHGFAYEFVCPARLHFNLRTKQCDYENEAHCESE